MSRASKMPHHSIFRSKDYFVDFACRTTCTVCASSSRTRLIWKRNKTLQCRHGLQPREIRGSSIRQHGQALAELMVAMLALCMLWTAVAWLGRVQDMALQAGHAARHLAFLGAQQAHEDWGQAARTAYFDGRRQRWLDRRGHDLLPQAQGISAQVSRLAPVAAQAQPANQHASGAQLRRDWQVADEGVMQASVAVSPGNASGVFSGPAWGDVVRGLDAAYPSIRRYAYILAGAGHADSDGQTQQRVARADQPWAQAAGVSYGLAGQMSGRMRQVDQAWGRSAPDNDWLYRWQTWLPDWHLR